MCLRVYKPPSTSYTIFVDELDKLLTEFNTQNPGCRIILAGDFNINILDAYSKSGDFIETTLSHCLYLSVYLSTIPSSNTLLDNISFCHGSAISTVSLLLLTLKTIYKY